MSKQQTMEEQLAILAQMDARQDTPGLYEWMRENGDAVQARVNSAGFIAVWINGEAQPLLRGGTYEIGCAAVEDLMNKETVR